MNKQRLVCSITTPIIIIPISTVTLFFKALGIGATLGAMKKLNKGSRTMLNGLTQLEEAGKRTQLDKLILKHPKRTEKTIKQMGAAMITTSKQFDEGGRIMADQARIEDLRRQLAKKALPFHSVFTAPEGVEVLKIIKAEFDPEVICSESVHETVIRAAQRDVVRYIENMIKLREEDYA